jgi:acyl-CoA synthetase (AMP-forming)/AMP-acid ligase II
MVMTGLQHCYGVAPGERVAVVMRNCPDWMIVFAAAASPICTRARKLSKPL